MAGRQRNNFPMGNIFSWFAVGIWGLLPLVITGCGDSGSRPSDPTPDTTATPTPTPQTTPTPTPSLIPSPSPSPTASPTPVVTPQPTTPAPTPTPTPLIVELDFSLRSGAVNEPFELKAKTDNGASGMYNWRLVAGPVDAGVEIADPSSAHSSILVDAPGCYHVAVSLQADGQTSDDVLVAIEFGTRLPEIIDQDTVLDQTGSPYFVESTRVTHGVTLDIEPSVSVIGPAFAGDMATGTLRVAGHLNAQGAPGQPVYFGQLAIGFADETQQNSEAEFDLSQVVMGTRSELFPIVLSQGGAARISVSDSLLEMELDSVGVGDKGDVWLRDVGNVVFQRNIFTAIPGISLISSRPATNIKFHDNWLAGDYAVFTESAAVSDGSVVAILTGNNLDVGQIRLLSGANHMTIVATHNWWGTTDVSLIEQRIFDCHDDPDIDACVEFQPILQEPWQSAPGVNDLQDFRDAMSGRYCTVEG